MIALSKYVTDFLVTLNKENRLHDQSSRYFVLLKLQRFKVADSFLSPFVKISVLLYLERNDLVFQSLRAVTQVIIQIASIQAKHGQRHSDVQWGNLFPQVIEAVDFLRIEWGRDDFEGASTQQRPAWKHKKFRVKFRWNHLITFLNPSNECFSLRKADTSCFAAWSSRLLYFWYTFKYLRNNM